jgi:TM2 domain-containing membrane protein YozV
MLSQIYPPRNRRTAILLAFAGIIVPGLHKFYLGQRGWGIAYLLFFWSGIPRIASLFEGIWFLVQGQGAFDTAFNGATPLPSQNPAPRIDPAQVGAIADALRQLDTLRQEGLISEYEFEQKRRRLLDQIG